MTSLRKLLIYEEFSLNVEGKKYKMKIKPNINPTKSGIRIQFSYEGEELSKAEKSKMESGLQNLLNKALTPYKMSVNTDPDVPREAQNVIGFYLTVEQLENFIVRSLKKVTNTKDLNKDQDNE